MQPDGTTTDLVSRSASGAATHRDEPAALSLYQALRRLGGAKAKEIQAAAGLSATQAERGWRRLEQLRLIQPSGEGMEPVDPDAALSEATNAYRENAVEQVRNAIALQHATEALTSVYRPAVAREDAEVAVEYLADERRKNQVIRNLTSSNRISTDSIHPGPMPPMDVIELSLRRDRAAVARGVRVRNIYPLSLLQRPQYARYLHDLTELGTEVRLVDHAPNDLLIFDGIAACLPADPADPSRAMVVVRGAALLRNYVAVYEDFWLRAILLAEATAASGGEEAAEGTTQERVVIRLMSTGLSDDQIARKLGVSRRTVQRAIAKLMDRLGAASRFEAGLKLAQDPESARVFAIPRQR